MSSINKVLFGVIATCTLFTTSSNAFFHHRGHNHNDDDSFYSSDDFTFNYEDPIDLAQGNFIGRVNIGASFILSFDLEVTQQHGGYWANILHIGNENEERSPGIWLYPSSTQLHIRLSDAVSWNSGTDPSDKLSLNTKYNIKLVVPGDGSVTTYLDDVEVTSATGVAHTTRFLAPIFACDPYYSPVIGTISNLIIEPYNSKDDDEYEENNEDNDENSRQEQSSFIVDYLNVAGADEDDTVSLNNLNNKNIGKIIGKAGKSNKNGKHKSGFGGLSMFWKVCIISGALLLCLCLLFIVNHFVMKRVIDKMVRGVNSEKVDISEINQYSSLLA